MYIYIYIYIYEYVYVCVCVCVYVLSAPHHNVTYPYDVCDCRSYDTFTSPSRHVTRMASQATHTHTRQNTPTHVPLLFKCCISAIEILVHPTSIKVRHYR